MFSGNIEIRLMILILIIETKIICDEKRWFLSG